MTDDCVELKWLDGPKRWSYSDISTLASPRVRRDIFSNNLGIESVKLTFLDTGQIRVFRKVPDGLGFVEVES